MKRYAFLLAILSILFLAAVNFSAPAQAALNQQTVPSPTATRYVPPTATPTPSATYQSPIPTPASCQINTKYPIAKYEDDLLVSISAEGAPGPGWRVVDSVTLTIVTEGSLNEGKFEAAVKLTYNVSYAVQIEKQDGWYSSRSCEMLFDKPTGPKPIISIGSQIVTVGDQIESCVTTSNITGYEVLSFQGYVQYPQNLELLDYSVGDVPSGDIDWGEGTNPNQLAYVKYQPNFMEGQGSLFCMKFRALSVGEDGWSIRFRYNDWPSSWMDFQTGTMTVVPTPIYLPAVSR